MTLPKWFTLDELVCEDVYNTYGKQAWSFFDSRLLITIDIIREHLGKPMYINDWQIHGNFRESGFRCNRCSIVKAKIATDTMYCSAHMRGQAVDFHVDGMAAEEVRQYLVLKQNLWPYPFRLESGVNWVHLDTCNMSSDKITFFKP
jgi:hypothetical protein